MARITWYTLSTEAERIVALDGVYQCPNPMCRYTSPFRAWGKGQARNQVKDTDRNLTMPGDMRIGVKRVAENNAWADAQRRYQSVRCPRCMGMRDPQLQFANP
jgi:hypothetical protein